MAEGWKESTLAEVLEVLRNGLSCKQNKSGLGHKISRIETVALGAFNMNRVGFAELSPQEAEKHRLQLGDILFSHINSVPHVGKTAIFNEDAEIYHGMNLLLMRPVPGVDPYFLNHYLNSLFKGGYWRTRCKKSVNQASVNQKDIKRVPMPLPPLPEQKRIVEALDEACANSAMLARIGEQKLAHLADLKQSLLHKAFTGELTTDSKAADRSLSEAGA